MDIRVLFRQQNQNWCQLFHIRYFVFTGISAKDINNKKAFDITDSCGFPGSPRNGTVGSGGMIFRPGEEVTFSCQEGFVLFGNDRRICRRNGTWSDTIPECSKKDYILF